jgi:hypothetical protein
MKNEDLRKFIEELQDLLAFNEANNIEESFVELQIFTDDWRKYPIKQTYLGGGYENGVPYKMVGIRNGHQTNRRTKRKKIIK